MASESSYYIYSMNDPRDNSIYYVGKGKGRRWWSHFQDHYFRNPKNPHKSRKIKKLQRLGYDPSKHISFFKTGLTEDEAYELEELIVDEIGIENLTNIRQGGDGGLGGSSLKEETKTKLSKSLRSHYKIKYNTNTISEVKWLCLNSAMSLKEIGFIYGLTKTQVRGLKDGKSFYEFQPKKPLWFKGCLKFRGFGDWASMVKGIRAEAFTNNATVNFLSKKYNYTYPAIYAMVFKKALTKTSKQII